MIDLTSDTGLAFFYQIAKLVELPGIVKESQVTSMIPSEHLPDNAYADVVGKKLPAHTKAACCLSYAYYLRQRDQLTKEAQVRVDAKFQSLTKYWSAETECKSIKDGFDKSAAPQDATDKDYALVTELNGDKLRYFPIDTKELLLKSAEELVASRDKLTYLMRHDASEKLLKRASALGVVDAQIPDAVFRMAGQGVGDKDEVLHQLQVRVKSANRQEKAAADMMKVLVDMYRTAPTVSAASLQKTAEAIDIYDRFTGLHQQYGKVLPYPEDVIFLMTKRAAEAAKAQLVSLTTGSSYLLPELMKCAAAFDALGDLRSSFCDAFGKLDVIKVADIVPTLPKDDAERFEEILKVSGVKPIKSMSDLAKVAMDMSDLFPAIKRAAEGDSAPKSADEFKKKFTADQSAMIKKKMLDGKKSRTQLAAEERMRRAKHVDGKFMSKAPNGSTSEPVKK